MTRLFEFLVVFAVAGAPLFANEAETVQVPDSIIGIWRFDLNKTLDGRAKQHPGEAAAVNRLKSGCVDGSPRISVTITDTELTVTSTTAGTRTRPYTTIGGNATLAVIQYTDRNGSERVANIQLVPGGISIAEVISGGLGLSDPLGLYYKAVSND